MEQIARLAAIITEERARFASEPFSEQMRWAAALAMEEFEFNAVTASTFGDAAASLGLHRQSAMNRFNEAKKNMEGLIA